MYWSERQKQLYAQLEKDEKKLNQRLLSYYKTEYSKLDKEIAAFYQKYGINNIIEYRTVMEALSDEDRALLIEQMDEFAKQYPQYAHLMPVRKNIYRLNRLEGLQQSVVMHQLKIGAVNETVITEYLNKQAKRGVTAAAKAMGFGTEFYFESADMIKNIIGVQWCGGKNFSERIWENTNKLAYYLTTDISQGFARGENYQKLTKQLRDKFLNVNAKDAYRLIYTEGTYVMAESTMQPFAKDFEKYKISTAADGKVCQLCADISHSVFYIKDRAAGVNFPPFHPWCRCTFEIVVDDWGKWIDNYVETHNTDKRHAENVLKNFGKNDIMNVTYDEEVQSVHYIGKINRDIYKCVTEDIVTEDVIITDERIKHIKERHPNDFEKYCQYMIEMVSSPEFIVEANKPKSALILKSFADDDKQFKAVLRLVTSSDNADFKNSIITFMKINNQEWKRLIKNKKILYKSE